VVNLATGTWLRIKEHGYIAGHVRTPEELAGFGIDMSEMEEIGECGSHARCSRSARR
jgi:hypothetical protein